MAMKVVPPAPQTTPTFTRLSQRAAVMRAAHAVAKGWMAQKNLVGDYQDFLKAAMRMSWDLARGVNPRVPTWAAAMPLPAEAKALVQGGVAAHPVARFECGEGENPFTAFMAAFKTGARWGWQLSGPNGHLLHLWADQVATAKVVATCRHNGEDHIFWSY